MYNGYIEKGSVEMAEIINEKTNKERWLELKMLWERERHPGFLLVGNHTYRVFRLENDVLEFREDKENREYYESTSF